MAEAFSWIQLGIELVAIVALGLVMNSRINALKGTVDAQKKALDAQAHSLAALGDLNKTALEVVKAVGPERWAREVQEWKDFIESKSRAFLEEERRRGRGEVETVEQRANAFMQGLAKFAEDALTAAGWMLVYVPASLRKRAVSEIQIPDRMKEPLYQIAEKVPDRSALGLASILGQEDEPGPPAR